jgi:hypothetical protein
MDRTNKLAASMTFCCAAFIGPMSNQVFAENPGGWEYSVAPLYLWAKNIEGTSAIGGAEAPLNLDFKDDVLENLDAAFSIHFEARQGDLTLFAEYNFARLDPTAEESLGPITVKSDIEFEDTMWELGVTYAFYNSDSTRWEVLGGVRYLEQDLDVKIDKPTEIPLPIPDRVTGGDDWWHGFGGVRGTIRITERWSFQGRADVGYQDSNNKALHVNGFFDYRFRDWGSFFAGYRYLETEYDNRESGPDGYAADLSQQGPILGVNFYF